MRYVVGLCLLILGSAGGAGCTFYTSCPTVSSSQTGAQGGSGGAGGSDNAGSDNAGAAGQPTGMWVNVTANLAGKTSQCGNLSWLSAKPDEDLLIATVALDGLWALQNGSDEWQALGQGKGSEQIVNRGTSITYDPDHPKTFWETGIYNSTGVYRTDDDGDTFVAPGDIQHNDFLSIDFVDPDRKTMLASGHEQAHTLYYSSDSGGTWKDIGADTPTETTDCPVPIVIDPKTFLLGCSTYGGGPAAIYRSTDTGSTWSLVSPLGSGTPPLITADGSIYWATAESSGGLVKSTDRGKTWSAPLGAGEVGTVTPIQLPDNRLAMLSSSAIVISADDGVTWKTISTSFPYPPVGFTYSVQRKAFYIWHFTCANPQPDNPVPDDAVERYDFDYEVE